jgi:hypothetical protein
MSKHKNPRHDPFWPSEPIASLPPDRLVGMRFAAAALGDLTTAALWLQVKQGRTPAPWRKVANRWVLEVGQLGLIAPKVPPQEAARRGRETQAKRRAAAKTDAAQAGASGPNAVSAGQDVKAARTAPVAAPLTP